VDGKQAVVMGVADVILARCFCVITSGRSFAGRRKERQPPSQDLNSGGEKRHVAEGCIRGDAIAHVDIAVA
jgi:hypothetical protein